MEVGGVGVADNAKRGGSMGAGDLSAVINQRPSNAATPHAWVDEQSV